MVSSKIEGTQSTHGRARVVLFANTVFARLRCTQNCRHNSFHFGGIGQDDREVSSVLMLQDREEFILN